MANRRNKAERRHKRVSAGTKARRMNANRVGLNAFGSGILPLMILGSMMR